MMTLGFSGITIGAGATAAADVEPATLTRGLAAGEDRSSGTFSSSAAVISQLGLLKRLNGGLTDTDRVLKMSASFPRSRLMSSSPSSSDFVLYVLTFIVLRLQGIRSERSAECHLA